VCHEALVIDFAMNHVICTHRRIAVNYSSFKTFVCDLVHPSSHMLQIFRFSIVLDQQRFSVNKYSCCFNIGDNWQVGLTRHRCACQWCTSQLAVQSAE